MADRSNNGNWKVPSVAESSHDHSKPEELGRRAAYDCNNVTKGAAYGRADKHVDRHKPPAQYIIKGDRLTEVDEDEAGKEESKDKLAEELEGGSWHNLGFRVGKYEANDREAQKLHQGHHG